MRQDSFATILFLLFLLAWADVPAASAAPAVTGKVAAADKKGEAGVVVSAWPADSLGLSGEAPHRSAPTGADGRFHLELPKDGEYYLVARGRGWYSFYGRNPVRVPDGGLNEVNLGLVREGEAAFSEQPGFAQGIIGQVLAGDKPMAGALVYLYLDPSSQFKGMGYGILGPTGANGLFAAELPPGTYYLMVRKRQQPGAVGPLQSGDFIGYWPDNPVRVGEGEVQRVAIPMLEVPEKVDRLQGSLFGRNSIEGRVVDHDGRPVAGIRVMLYEDAQMLNRPLYVSQPTDADGRYQLSFAYGGKYYVGARSSIGGQPAPGELVGAYAGTPDYTVRVKEGDHLKNIDITVGEMW